LLVHRQLQDQLRVLLLAGMAKIDASLYEAAQLDGAGPVREFLSITLPSLPGSGLQIWGTRAVDKAGNVFITDSGNGRIRKVDQHGIITTIAGTGTFGYNGDGPATGANLSSPQGVAADAAGNVYIADTGHNRVRKVFPSGAITTINSSAAAVMIPPVRCRPPATADRLSPVRSHSSRIRESRNTS
jgi:hypothetical protein